MFGLFGGNGKKSSEEGGLFGLLRDGTFMGCLGLAVGVLGLLLLSPLAILAWAGRASFAKLVGNAAEGLTGERIWGFLVLSVLAYVALRIGGYIRDIFVEEARAKAIPPDIAPAPPTVNVQRGLTVSEVREMMELQRDQQAVEAPALPARLTAGLLPRAWRGDTTGQPGIQRRE